MGAPGSSFLGSCMADTAAGFLECPSSLVPHDHPSRPRPQLQDQLEGIPRAHTDVTPPKRTLSRHRTAVGTEKPLPCTGSLPPARQELAE